MLFSITLVNIQKKIKIRATCRCSYLFLLSCSTMTWSFSSFWNSQYRNFNFFLNRITFRQHTNSLSSLLMRWFPCTEELICGQNTCSVGISSMNFRPLMTYSIYAFTQSAFSVYQLSAKSLPKYMVNNCAETLLVSLLLSPTM